MNLNFFPAFFASSDLFSTLRAHVADKSSIEEVLLGTQLAVNSLLAALGGFTAATGVADTFVAYNPELFGTNGRHVFAITVVSSHSLGETSGASACTILFQFENGVLEVVPLWNS